MLSRKFLIILSVILFTVLNYSYSKAKEMEQSSSFIQSDTGIDVSEVAEVDVQESSHLILDKELQNKKGEWIPCACVGGSLIILTTLGICTYYLFPQIDFGCVKFGMYQMFCFNFTQV